MVLCLAVVGKCFQAVVPRRHKSLTKALGKYHMARVLGLCCLARVV